MIGDHGFEDFFDHVEPVSAACGGGDVAEDFPVFSGNSGGVDGFVESLEAAGDVDHAAAFFLGFGEGEDDVGHVREVAGHGAAVDDGAEWGELFFGESGLFGEEVFVPGEDGFYGT